MLDLLKMHWNFILIIMYLRHFTDRETHQGSLSNLRKAPELACVRKGSLYLGLTLKPVPYSLGKAASLLAVRPVRLLLCAK